MPCCFVTIFSYAFLDSHLCHHHIFTWAEVFFRYLIVALPVSWCIPCFSPWAWGCSYGCSVLPFLLPFWAIHIQFLDQCLFVRCSIEHPCSDHWLWLCVLWGFFNGNIVFIINFVNWHFCVVVFILFFFVHYIIDAFVIDVVLFRSCDCLVLGMLQSWDCLILIIVLCFVIFLLSDCIILVFCTPVIALSWLSCFVI